MRQVTLYTRAGCHLCEAAREALVFARRRVEFTLEVVDIDGDDELRRRYDDEVPVVAIDGHTVFRGAVDVEEFLNRVK